jgi:hypothetical protein
MESHTHQDAPREGVNGAVEVDGEGRATAARATVTGRDRRERGDRGTARRRAEGQDGQQQPLGFQEPARAAAR